MDGCADTLSTLVLAIPPTLAGVAAVVAALRNGRAQAEHAEKVGASLTQLSTKQDAYQQVISDLAPRVKDEE